MWEPMGPLAAGSSRLSANLALALGVSAGLLAVLAVAAGGSGATGLAALASLGAMASAATGWLAWRSARELEESVEAVTNALQALAESGLRGAEIQRSAAGDSLVEAYNGMTRRLSASLEDLDRSRREFRRAIARLGDALAATHDRDGILEVVRQTAQLAVGGDQAVFFEFNAARRLLVARSGLPAAASGSPIAPGTGLAGTAAAREEPMAFPGDAEPVAPEPRCTTAMAVPFFTRGELLGIVAVYGRRTAVPFGTDDLEALTALVSQAETAVDNVSLHEEAQRLSITDGLTGLWNRRELELRCQYELERAARFGRPIGVIFCDIDHFKEINDDEGWGHAGGDSVLVEVAHRLASATREIDVVARYGGEEFVLLLPETDLSGSLVLAEKVRKAVADEPVEHAGSTRQVTLSMGVAAYPHSGTNVRTLLAAADAALFKAKRAGRNRVEQADPVIRNIGTG
jgi:two-component system cell cycle response regulator